MGSADQVVEPLETLAQINRFVFAVEIKPGLRVERGRVRFALIDREADRTAAAKQDRRELRKASLAVTFRTILRVNVNSFEVNHLGRIADDVGLENWLSVLNPNPDASL